MDVYIHLADVILFDAEFWFDPLSILIRNFIQFNLISLTLYSNIFTFFSDWNHFENRSIKYSNENQLMLFFCFFNQIDTAPFFSLQFLALFFVSVFVNVSVSMNASYYQSTERGNITFAVLLFQLRLEFIPIEIMSETSIGV